MKNFTITLLIVAGAFQAFSQANTELSNLVSPTKVNVNLLPKGDNTKNLGSNTKSWQHLYLDGNIYRSGEVWLAGGYATYNTFVGSNAGFTLIPDQSINQGNTFVGANAGYYTTTTANANTFIGNSAGYFNTTGGLNTFVGDDAGRDNSTGSLNIFIGNSAGVRNATGKRNVFIGHVAGGFNDTGNSNIYVGSSAGYENEVGHYNTMIGDSAGRQTTTSNNTMVGSKSGDGNTEGSFNTFLGANAAIGNTDGSFNVAVGYFSLDDNTSSTGNTSLGYSSGTLYENGSYNSFLGYDADATSSGLTNVTAVGNSSRVTANNHVRIGNSAVSSIGGYAPWTDVSDQRFKKEVRTDVPGLEFINKLNPVTYTLDVSGIRQFLREDGGLQEHQSAMHESAKQDDSDAAAVAKKELIRYTGFLAQEVAAAASEVDYDFSGIDAPENEQSLYGLRYAQFVVPLVKAVQELDEENESLKAEIGMLKSQVEDLKDLIEDQLGVKYSPTLQLDPGIIGANESLLGQNIPNPFDQSTVIPFRIPAGCKEASIVITESGSGRMVQVIPITCDETFVQVQANRLQAGSFQYALYVNGKEIGMKQMILQH